MRIKAQDTEIEESSTYESPNYFDNIESDGGGDWFLQAFFYINILWFLTYCRFITTITFKMSEDDEDYSEYRDICVAGAYYELQYSTQVTSHTKDDTEW